MKPWRKAQWCIATVGSDFVWRMEDVLDLYAQPYDPQRPQVCFDERPVQLLKHVYDPLPAQPGQVKRYDYEYERNGTANLFVLCQPLAGWRMVKATAQRKKVDFADCMRELVDVHFPDAEVSGSCWITSTPIPPLPYMRLLHPLRHGVFSVSWSSITLRLMARG